MFIFDRRNLARLALSLGLVAAALSVQAQSTDGPGRVGRLSQVEGKVWFYDTEQGQWVEGLRNQPLTGGDRLSTERGARAEVRVGSTELRLDGDTEIELARVDDDRMVFRLESGSLALRVRSSELAREAEVRTDEARIVPERAGHFRIDRDGEMTLVSAWRGAVRVDSRDQQVQVVAGRRVEFHREGPDATTAVTWSSPDRDAFSDWVARDEQRDDRSVAQRYVSPEMTGAEDLDRYGRWERHPEYGMVWAPLAVSMDWAPYRTGRWTWHARWGWTWVDEQPWGFAPFHYGRWVPWRGRWVWSPGAYVARPVFAPALVAWVGGPNASFSISVGGYSGPAVGWVPLAPRDVYVPPFAYSPRYYERVNRPHREYRPKVPAGPVMYGNKGVPGAVTVVPSDVLVRHQPVAPRVVRDRDTERDFGRQPFRHENPVAQPGRQGSPRVMPVPGGAEPVRVAPAPGRDTAGPRRPFVERREKERERERVEPVAAPRAVPQQVGPVPQAPAVRVAPQRREAPAPARPRPAPAPVPAPAPAAAEPPRAEPQRVDPTPSPRENRDRGNVRERDQRSQRPPQPNTNASARAAVPPPEARRLHEPTIMRRENRGQDADARQNQRERQNAV